MDKIETTDGSAFAAAVTKGLMRSEGKSLPCEFIYDAYGSEIFKEIFRVPEYYPGRCENALIQEHVSEIAALCDKDVAVVELGAGDALKTQSILKSLRNRGAAVQYYPIDISAAALNGTAARLRDELPDITVTPILGEYKPALRQLASELRQTCVLALWLGTSVGNLEPDESIAILRSLRQLATDACLLLGVDLKKDRRILERAYNDSRGVTARFNLNLLARINRELGGHFDLATIEHRSIYNEEAGRIEMHLVSRCRQNVAIDGLGITVSLKEGEAIHTENSYKFSRQEIEKLASAAGFRLSRHWLDDQALYSLNVFQPVS